VCKLAERRIVNSVDDISFGLKNTFKAIEQRRENLIIKGIKSEQELLEFLKASPNTYFYEVTKKLSWSKGKVAKAMQRLDKKGIIQKSDYLKINRSLIEQ
jgi:hypothetical protein